MGSKEVNPIYRQELGLTPSRGDLRKIQIIEAVIEMVATKGVDQTNYETIAKKLKMLRAHVAYHFPKKEKMMELVFRYVHGMGQSYAVNALIEASDPQSMLEQYIVSTFDWLDKYPNHRAVMLLFYYYASTKKPFKALHSEIRELARGRLKGILSKFTKKKVSPKVIDATAVTIHSIMTGNLLEFATTDSQRPLSHWRNLTVQQSVRAASTMQSH